MATPTPYLDVAGFRLRTMMHEHDVDQLEASAPGYIAARIAIQQEEIDGRLRKRYAVPFEAPVSEKVLGWLTDLVTLDAYRRRGRDPQSPEMQDVKDAADLARAELKEAADSKDGLYDLPLREDSQDSAIVSGGPLGCSQVSPYEWIDEEAERLR